MFRRRGNCYVASEALYHLIGGKSAGWKPMRMRHEGSSHWFLQGPHGVVLDVTARQFKRKVDYERGIGCGFLTKQPSKRAAALMDMLVWKQGRKDA